MTNAALERSCAFNGCIDVGLALDVAASECGNVDYDNLLAQCELSTIDEWCAVDKCDEPSSLEDPNIVLALQSVRGQQQSRALPCLQTAHSRTHRVLEPIGVDEDFVAVAQVAACGSTT